MKIETRYNKSTTIGGVADVRDMNAHHGASITAVAAVIAAAVLLVITVMMGLGSLPFPN